MDFFFKYSLPKWSVARSSGDGRFHAKATSTTRYCTRESAHVFAAQASRSVADWTLSSFFFPLLFICHENEWQDSSFQSLGFYLGWWVKTSPPAKRNTKMSGIWDAACNLFPPCCILLHRFSCRKVYGPKFENKKKRKDSHSFGLFSSKTKFHNFCECSKVIDLSLWFSYHLPLTLSVYFLIPLDPFVFTRVYVVSLLLFMFCLLVVGERSESESTELRKNNCILRNLFFFF